jgi:transposase
MRTQKLPEEFGFDRYDKGRLGRALKKAPDKRAYQRIQAVLLFAQGTDVHRVAKITRKSVRVIYHWVSLYLKHHQVKALYDAPKSGRPIAAPQITEKRMLKELARNPLDLGYNTTVWTVSLLARHLSALYHCEIRPFTLYRRMKQIGLRSKRPKYVYSEKDPSRAQKKGPLSES